MVGRSRVTLGGLSAERAEFMLAPHVHEAISDQVTQPYRRFNMRIGAGVARPGFTDYRMI
jgi:hypothetical protein